MAELTYEIVDVFTDQAFAGNPLAVVLGADSLSGSQLQTLAREFNLSETVFPLRPTVAGADYRVRIFTPAAELPFAGHPCVGCAVTLARLGLLEHGTRVQECGAGLIPMEVLGNQATLSGGPVSVGPELSPSPLLSVVGLMESDFVGPAPRTTSAGIPHTFLSVSPSSVSRAVLDLAASREHDVPRVTVFSWNAEARRSHARMFDPGHGVLEDPATGSSALAFGVYLVASGLVPPSGETPYGIDQGAEMGRPSLLCCTVEAENGLATRTTVTGQVVPIARGTIRIP
ncbi:PhzF family phenazine biosynthesis protein [Tenggerimyces flavus]|uniref:PhzF family phenazine biosynthesis protein n=1 Tax=Tenggerimyces flavus TaxID=1708749 RepID=A0ABV7YCE5_9ACTN|nr:PhzF family phenazine biosynthesis protein [Tenggerimyces flavus]MBM7783332.1 trans-2,3-dihydro-3-hydroxyanthranilate isomerase [Tenggerimyces flavus]